MGPLIGAVVTHHRDRFRSGVAGFNAVLAERLGVPLLGLDALAGPLRRPLLSFKVRELGDEDTARVARVVDERPYEWEVFLHEYAELPLEQQLVESAAAVYAGNAEIAERVGGAARVLWAPGLLLDKRELPAADVSVFSFGMAHKLRTEMFHKLASLLERTGRSYAVYASAANHETASLRDTEIVFQEMHDLFRDSLYFLGNLSDVAVWHYLGTCTFYAAFFEGGVRANNTSVASAMERGAVVITNLDRWSPPELVHMENVIDITRCDELPLDPGVLARIGANASETARSRSWDALVDRLE